MFGCYFASSNKEEAAQHLTMTALDAVPKVSKPLLIGKLKSNLEFSWDKYVDRRKFFNIREGAGTQVRGVGILPLADAEDAGVLQLDCPSDGHWDVVGTTS